MGGAAEVVETTVEFDASAYSIRAARRFVQESCADAVPPDVTDDLVLATSELVTNAIEHGVPLPVRVTVRVAADEASIAVRSYSDPGRIRDVADWRPAPADRRSGRGLSIVKHLADRVDVVRSGDSIEIIVRRSLG